MAGKTEKVDRKPRWRVLKGFNFSRDGKGSGYRFEPGNELAELPDGCDIAGLLAKGAIVEIGATPEGESGEKSG